VEILEGLGLHRVRTYIQSGNVVFQSEHNNNEQLSRQISAAIGQSHGFTPRILLLNSQEFQEAIVANPFPDAANQPKTLHLYFLNQVPPNPDLETLESIRKNGEQFRLIKKVFYLHAPDGIGRSKLAEKVEQALGVAATARNWRTAIKIMSIAEGVNKSLRDGIGE
jgi:uncharacterized protein (DUF1697 family)